MPGGALVGTVVHSVFERLDFDAPDLAAAVGEALDHETTWRNVDLGHRDTVVHGLCTAVTSSLGTLADGRSLRNLSRADRLDELTFEIPLVGGDTPTATLEVTALADLLESHLPADDPVARYAARLRDPSLAGLLRGYLTGSLDLVFRLGERYLLADYKTNKLGAGEQPLTAWHYRPEALQAEMVAAHYPLQAVLYSVALHRYLRWRLPDYDPDRHLAGVLYLFVRGMSAAEPTTFDDEPCGVWSWRPPAALVDALSDAFDRGAP
jgi:exodeoxyribonuclease V beta subunit